MNLNKELLDFLESNNWLSLEDEENAKGVVASYIKVYKPELHKEPFYCADPDKTGKCYDEGFEQCEECKK